MKNKHKKYVVVDRGFAVKIDGESLYDDSGIGPKIFTTKARALKWIKEEKESIKDGWE